MKVLTRTAAAAEATSRGVTDMWSERFKAEQEYYEQLRALHAERDPVNTAKLPPHNPDAICPKCGADAARIPVIYHAAAPDDDWRFRSTLPCVGKFLAEHLCRTCGRCGYSWQERVIEPATPNIPA